MSSQDILIYLGRELVVSSHPFVYFLFVLACQTIATKVTSYTQGQWPRKTKTKRILKTMIFKIMDHEVFIQLIKNIFFKKHILNFIKKHYLSTSIHANVSYDEVKSNQNSNVSNWR